MPFASFCLAVAILMVTQAAIPPTQGQCPEQKIFASDGDVYVYFGESISISGDTAIILGNGPYAFRDMNGAWIEIQKLPVPANEDDLDFRTVSVSEDVAIAAMYFRDEGDWREAGVIYRSVGEKWVLEETLILDSGFLNDPTGLDASINGDLAVIGSNYDDEVGVDAGAAYVFRYSDGVWVEEMKLIASDAQPFKNFGQSISVSGNVVLVAAYDDGIEGVGVLAGAVYVFRMVDGIWSEEQKLIDPNGESSYDFGQWLSLRGNDAIIGSLYYENGLLSSVAYIYRYHDGVWIIEAEISFPAIPPDGTYSTPVSIDGDVATIGSRNDSSFGQNSGAASVYRRAYGDWFLQQELTAWDAAPDEYFGTSVAVQGDTIFVGSINDDDLGPYSGSVYVYCVVPLGDADGDEDADLADFSLIRACLTGPGVAIDDPACLPADLNRSYEVDLKDYAILQASFTGL